MSLRESLLDKQIVFVFTRPELGGAERQGLILARYLRDECQAGVVVWGLSAGAGRLGKLCQEFGVPCRSIEFNAVGPVGWLKSLWRLVAAMRRAKPDILVPYGSLPNVACGLAWRLTGAEASIWNQRDEGLSFGRAMLHRLAVWLTPLFVSNSKGGKELLVRQFGVEPGRIAVVHNGAFLPGVADDRTNWRRRLGAADGQFVACMVANFSRYKDHLTLIEAWQSVLEQLNGNGVEPFLVLAGRDDGCLDELRALVEKLGIGRLVRFIEFTNDVAGLLHASDVCVYSSRSEGMPNGVLEAMVAGLPVVGTDIPGIREAVGPLGAPFLASPGEPATMARLILKLLADPETRLTLGKAMQQRAGEEFAVERMCRSSAELIASQLDKSR